MQYVRKIRQVVLSRRDVVTIRDLLSWYGLCILDVLLALLSILVPIFPPQNHPLFIEDLTLHLS